MGTDLNTAILLGDGYQHQIQRIGVREHCVSYPISRITDFLLFGERNVSGFIRISYISGSWLRKKDILIKKGQFQEKFPGMPSIIFLNVLGGAKLMENHV